MEPALTQTSSLWIEYLKLIFVLGGVVLAAWLVLRFWLPSVAGRVKGGAEGPLEVIAHQSLEPRKTLFIVRAGSSLLLLGSSEAGLAVLERLDPEDRCLASLPRPAKPAFPQLLRFKGKG